MDKITIQGAVGVLQGAWHEVEGSEDCLIICHPHPQFDGTMDNKVVTTVAKSYLDLGINVLRFNFRGVGESAGAYGNIDGEVDDCIAALTWLMKEKSVKRLFLAGFSFGCYVAAKVAFELPKIQPNLHLEHLLMVAPSVINSPFEKVIPLMSPSTVIMGALDEVVPFDAVSEWAESLYPPVEFIELSQATHFFHGQLVILKQEVKASLAPHI